MSCILRAGGENFDVEKFMELCPMKADSFWKKGEQRFPKSTVNFKLNEHSGIRFIVSDAEFSELPQQIEDAITFFTANKSEIAKLSAFQGVEGVVLDFGAEIQPPGWSSFTLPPNLMLLVSVANVSLCISVYPSDESDAKNA
jgi:hypothetical protein